MHFYRVTSVLKLGAVLVRAIGDVKLPAMPRASDDAAVKGSLAQRPPMVWAGALKSPVIIADAKQGDNFALDDHFRPGVRGTQVQGAQFMP